MNENVKVVFGLIPIFFKFVAYISPKGNEIAVIVNEKNPLSGLSKAQQNNTQTDRERKQYYGRTEKTRMHLCEPGAFLVEI